jgi:NAD(P)-dependent dehydrogenase (short-subunit alcohol dehydrogenase family)
MLAANGAAVMLVARRAERLAEFKSRIEGAGGRAVAVAVEVVDRAAMRRAFDAAEKAFGAVTILVNNAGVGHSGRALELPEPECRRVLDTNLDAVFFWAQEAARRMLAAGKRGAIVNTASVLGLGVAKGVLANAVAKAGVVQLPRRWRSDSRSRACASTPLHQATSSPTSTANGSPARAPRMTREIPVGRFGEEADLDGALLLLASDAGRYITGATVVVDGGQIVGLRGA